MKRATWILMSMLAACDGVNDSMRAAEMAAGPVSRCVATNHDALCVDGHSVFACTLDGIFFHVATCKRIGALVPTAEQVIP